MTNEEFLALADSAEPISPVPPPPVAMGLRVAAELPIAPIATYLRCSVKTVERAERGIFASPRSINRERYSKALKACETWLAEHKPGALSDILRLWRDLLEHAQRKVS